MDPHQPPSCDGTHPEHQQLTAGMAAFLRGLIVFFLLKKGRFKFE
jgi:hypothetical protein